MKTKWSKWEHVMFVEDWRAGTPAYEILRSVNVKTNGTRYKRVKVGNDVYDLAAKMNIWYKENILKA